MKEIYVRTKLVNGTYVYAPKGTEDTYGTVLIDNDTLKYDDNNKLKVDVSVINRELNEELWNEINKKLDKTAVVQETGNSTTKVMSQNAVRENFAWLVGGKVPASQLPSYVDDVVEYDSKSAFPATGETGKIYVDKSTNLTYRWSNSNNYIMVGGGDLNLENGTGTGSLVQKTVSSSGTPYNNQASGSGAIALGKDVKSNGNTTFVIGQKNEAIVGTMASFTSGYSNINRGNYNITGGENNANNNSWNLVVGKNNAVSDGRFGIVSGLDNVYTGKGSTYNTAVSMLGNNLYVQSGYMPTNGALLIGQYNKVQNNSGRLFIVGNGTSNDDRKNAFEVLEDGRAKVQSAPVDDDDVVRKGDLSGVGGGTKLYKHEITVDVEQKHNYVFIFAYLNHNTVINTFDLLFENRDLLKGSTIRKMFQIPVENDMGILYDIQNSYGIITIGAILGSGGPTGFDLTDGYSMTDTVIEL